MQSTDMKMTQAGLTECDHELTRMEMELALSKVSPQRRREIEERKQEIYELYPMLKDD